MANKRAQHNSDITLGDTVRDIVTGFEGVVVVNRTEYLNDCVRYGVQAPCDKDGKITQSEYFWHQLEIVKRTAAQYNPSEVALTTPRTATGGPQRSEPPHRR